MTEDEKKTLIADLANSLKVHAANFALTPGNLDRIAENIVDDFVRYAEYRNGAQWEKDEGYKWKLIKARFNNSQMKPIPDFLPDEFFTLKSNLCGDFRTDLFDKQDHWKKISLAVFNTVKLGEEINATEQLFQQNSQKSNLQSAALLLFYLFPLTFCPYNHTSLMETAKKWEIPDKSPMKSNGKKCYDSWVKFINEIMIPSFKNEFRALKSLDDLPVGIPLDIQDFIYWLDKPRRDNLAANTPSHNQTGIAMLNTFRETLLKLRANKQLILTGAPGTGKTYLAQRLAAWMISERPQGELNEKTILEESNKLDKALKEKNNGQESDLASRFEFVQFHPGYDYSDFVEGLKPDIVEDTGQVLFKRKAGIFTEFCNRARLSNQQPIFDHAYIKLQKKIFDATDNTLTLKTAQNKGFKVEFNSHGNLRLLFGTNFANKASITKENLQLRYWNQKLSYISLNSYIDGVIKYMKSNCNLPEYKGKQKPQAPTYVLVIDEINRADLSRVFGELFYGLEEAYRDIPIKTQYSYLKDDNELDFVIPQNVYIIGTMNDIDRSVESMDFALRRRFAWHEITALESEHIIDASDIKNKKDEIIQEAKERMRRLNKALEEKANLGPEYMLGGAYFKKIEKYCNGGVADYWEALWKNHLAVILREYLRGRKNANVILTELKNAYKNTSVPGNPAP